MTIVALLGVIGMAIAWTATTAVQLAATALIMGGTEHPLTAGVDEPDFIESYLQNAINEFINPASEAPTGTGGDPIASVDIDGIPPDDDVYAVTYPAEFFPVFGSATFDDSVAVGVENLNGCVRGTGCTYNEDVAEPPSPLAPPVAGDEFVVFSYSQSAVAASIVKQNLIENPPPAGTDVSFFFLANPKRPNGGFLSRGPAGLTIPILGVTFSEPTPTNSCEVGECFESVDFAAQYDGLGGDAAVGLTNVPAVINAAMGYLLLHGNLANASFSDGLYQGSFGDTDYYLVPAQRLPLLMPFDPIVPSPILTALDTIVRPLIEGGYRRDINPGVPVAVSLLPFHNPVQTLVNLLVAIPTAIDDAIAEASGDESLRPLGTKPVTSPFGVGGIELPEPPSETNLSAFSNSDARIRSLDESLEDGDADLPDGKPVADSKLADDDDDDDAINDGRQNENNEDSGDFDGTDGSGDGLADGAAPQQPGPSETVPDPVTPSDPTGAPVAGGESGSGTGEARGQAAA